MMGEGEEAAREPQVDPEMTSEMGPGDPLADARMAADSALAAPEAEAVPEAEPEMEPEPERDPEPERVVESGYRPLESLEPDAAIGAATERFLAPLAAAPGAEVRTEGERASAGGGGGGGGASPNAPGGEAAYQLYRGPGNRAPQTLGGGATAGGRKKTLYTPWFSPR